MAETNARKRPIGFVEASTVETDDFLLIDGQTSGTRKIKPDKVGKANTSDLNNDAGFQNASEVAAAIAANIDDGLDTAGKAADAKAVGDALATKVDAASGKGLSTNDYTTAEKTKLAGVAAGATRVLIDSGLSDSGKAADAAAVGAALDGKVAKETGKGLLALDATLTQTGQAADAKKTGDEITLVKQDNSKLNDYVFASESVIKPDWANKAVSGSTGEQSASNSARCSNTTLIHVPVGGTLSIKPNTSGLNVEVYRFVNGSFVGTIDTVTSERTYKGDVSVRVLINYTDNRDIDVSTADTLVTIKIYADTLKLSKSMTYTNNMLYELQPVSGYYNSSKHHDSATYRYFAAIPVESNTSYSFYPRARFFTVVSGTTVVQAVSDDNITSVTTTSAGYAYVTYYTAEDINTYKMYKSSDLDCPPYGARYLSDDILIKTSSESTKDVLYGKKWIACGDSFTQGAFSGETDPTTFDNDPYYGKLKVYPFFIGRRTGMNVINEAVGGSTMTDIDGSHQRTPFSYQRYQAIPSDADYITLYFGINDYNYNAPIGTITDATNTTFYGAWNVVLSWLIANRPHAKIGIIITNGSMENGLQTSYTEAEIAIAKKYGIPYLNLALDDKIPYFCRQWERTDVDASVKRARDAYYEVSNTNFHPNVKAHEFESTFIESWLRTL